MDFIKDYLANETAVLASLNENFFSYIIGYGPGLIIAFVLLVIVGYFANIASLRFILSEKFKESFNFKAIGKMAYTKQYFVAWLVASLVSWIIAILTLTLNPANTVDSTSSFAGLPIGAIIIFIVVSSLVNFIIRVFTNTLYGEVFEKQEPSLAKKDP